MEEKTNKIYALLGGIAGIVFAFSMGSLFHFDLSNLSTYLLLPILVVAGFFIFINIVAHLLYGLPGLFSGLLVYLVLALLVAPIVGNSTGTIGRNITLIISGIVSLYLGRKAGMKLQARGSRL